MATERRLSLFVTLTHTLSQVVFIHRACCDVFASRRGSATQGFFAHFLRGVTGAIRIES
jgi:hypothetical protein